MAVVILSVILVVGLIAVIGGLVLGFNMKVKDGISKYVSSIALIYGGGIAVNIGFWGLLIYFALKLFETYS